MAHALDHDDRDIVRSLYAASARGDGNDMHTALCRYREWSHARGEQPLRPLDPSTATLAQKAAEAARLMRFVHWGIRHLGVSPETMMGYMSIINANHRRRTLVGLAGDMDLALLAELAKGMARSHVPRPAAPDSARPRGCWPSAWTQPLAPAPLHLTPPSAPILGRQFPRRSPECSAGASPACRMAGSSTPSATPPGQTCAAGPRAK